MTLPVIAVVPVQVKVNIIVTPTQAHLVLLFTITGMALYVPIGSIASTPITMFVKAAFQVVVLGVNYPTVSARVRVPLLAVEQGHPFE
jgi:hypothetical protein